MATLAALTVTTALAACGGGAGAARPSAAAPLISAFERRTGDTVSRDCGYSSPLPGGQGRSLWLFCDTEILDSGPRVLRLILGTDTAAAGPSRPGRVPGPLSEIPSPQSSPDSPGTPVSPGASAPEPFLPAPGGLTLPGGAAPCAGGGAYPAAWISGVTAAPPSAGPGLLLITYDDYCVTRFPGAAADAEGFGIAEYDPARNAITALSPVFTGPLPAPAAGWTLPAQQTLGSPVIGRDGYLYLVGYGPGGVYLARVPAAPAFWENPFAYQYLTGAGWSAQPGASVSLLPSASPPLGVAAGDFSAAGRGLVMIEQTSLSGDFTVWQASSPAGPWQRLRSGRVPCTAPPAHGAGRQAGDLCRALIGHPELSTRGRLMLSFFNPGTGHVELSPYPWRQ